jgi:hypothetical protein
MAKHNEEIYPYREGYPNSLPRVLHHITESPTSEARFAMAILERWAMVSAREDGEDSSGRQKLRLLPVEEVVNRACDIAETAYGVFRARDWMLTVPTIEDINEAVSKREDERENGDPRKKRR